MRCASLSLTVVALASSALPAIADSYTTRIEPRQFYGATVTLEEGVRVFRPLPPTRHVIINPQGSTPLNLSFQDVRVTEERTINNVGGGTDGDSAPVYNSYGGGFYGPGLRGFGFKPGFHGNGIQQRQGGRPAFAPAR